LIPGCGNKSAVCFYVLDNDRNYMHKAMTAAARNLVFKSPYAAFVDAWKFDVFVENQKEM